MTTSRSEPAAAPERAVAAERWVRERRNLIEHALEKALPAPERWPRRLHEAMSWSLFGGGKRVRPILTLAAFEAVGGAADWPFSAVMPAACAVEMLHTYSLIHDDLPAMDDDDERRGRATCHVQFGEGAAVLAGDALLTEAFRVVLDPSGYAGTWDADLAAQVASGLARAGGWLGMVGGQSLDLGLEGPVQTEPELAFLHRRKTGELFRFSCWAGAVLGRGTDAQHAALGELGEVLGLAFQVVDDVLDAEQDGGKPVVGGTPSFPGLLGLEASRARADALVERALGLLEPFGESAEPLRHLAWMTVHRDR